VTTDDPTYPPIVVLLGGPSAEHDVSIVSGTAIADALLEAGLDVRQVLIDLEGRWWWLPRDHRRDGRPQSAYDEPAELGADGPSTIGAALDAVAELDPAPVVFIALHGPFGEDGTVQALLDAVGLAYTGSGVLGSAVGMDKVVQKRLWRGLGLPVIDWREVRASEWRARPEAILGAVRYDTLAIVERYLAGARDLEISVIGNEPPLGIYGPGEIVAGHEFYDYAAKYTPGLSETSTRAEVPEPMRVTMRKLARDAYRSVGAEGFARVDFLVRDEAIYLSEINTIPGFTPISLFPTLPAEGGLDFQAVCLRVIDLAIERHAARPAVRLRPEDLPR